MGARETNNDFDLPQVSQATDLDYVLVVTEV